MNNYTCLVFDLDGTLVQSSETIYYTMIKSFNEIGVAHNVTIEKFNTMIGWHFEDIFKNVGVKVDDFEKFISIYENLYFDYIDKSTLYNYVELTLRDIKKRGIEVALLTTKGQDQAVKIIKHFDLDKYFDTIMGRRPGVAHKPSPEPLEIIMKELSAVPEKTMMIGDTEMDIQCGKNANAGTCGVTYGYRSEELIDIEAPDYKINDLSELINILEN